MKKTILTLALFLGSLIATQAQFSTDPSNNLKVSNTTRAISPHVKTLPNGDMYIAYLSPEMYGTIGSSFFVKLQMLDKKGNVASGWPVGGIYISKNFTATYDTDFGMEVTADGSVILVVSDSRDKVNRDSPIFRPYAYKINKNAQFVWDSAGVPMVSDQTRTHCQKPKVFLNNSGSPIVSWSDATNEPTSAVFTRLNPATGEKIFEPVSVPAAIQPLIVPSDGDNIIITYVANPNPGYITAVKYDRGGNQITTGAWAEPIRLGQYQVMTNNPIASAQSDGEGGAIVCWHALDNSSHYSMIQRITKNGALTMGDGGTRASGEYVHCTAPQLAVDVVNKEAYVLFIKHYSAERLSALVAKLNYNGQYVFPDSMKVVVGDAYSRFAEGLSITNDGVVGILTLRAGSVANPIKTAFYMNRNGNIRWGGDTTIVTSMTGGKATADISAYDKGQIIVTWAMGGESASSLYAQNVIIDTNAFLGVNPIGINATASFKTYPNPATDHVNIQLDLTSRQNVTIEILDIQGKKITVLADNRAQDGTQTYTWRTTGMTKGVYFISVQIGQTRKMSKVIIQ